MTNRSSVIRVTLVVGALVVLGLVLVLSSGVFSPDISSYFPLEVGNTWSYETTQRSKIVGGVEPKEGEKLGTIEQRVVGVSRLSSEELQIFEISQTNQTTGSADEPASTIESSLHMSATPTAVLLHAVDFGEPGATQLEAPVPLLQEPPSADPVRTQLQSAEIEMTVKSQEVEAVEVRAGKFPKALKRYAEGTVTGEMSNYPIRSGTIKETSWFVRDVGLVKQVRVLEVTLQSPEGFELQIEEVAERALTGFSIAKAD